MWLVLFSRQRPVILGAINTDTKDGGIMAKAFADKLDLAKQRLLLRDPFFATIAMRMQWEESSAIPAAATDGRRVLFNPEWCGALSDEQLLGVVRHEVMHIVCKDHLRRGERDPQKWNIATDHRINLSLLEHGSPDLPQPNCSDKKYAGMEAEKIYRLLPSQPQGKGKGQGFPGDIGSVMDATDASGQRLDEAAAESMGHEIDAMVMQAAQAAKLMGKGSPMIDRLVGAITRGQVDYRTALASLFHAVCRDDYSWTKANRGHLWRGVILPSLSVPAPPTVGVFIDTSGSIGGPEITAFMSEVEWLVSSTGARVLIGSVDDRMHGEPEEFGRESLPINYKPKGGGSTDFRPAFSWVEEHRPDLAAIVYLTDLNGSFPDRAPHCPTLWVATSEAEVPFGMRARIEVG